MARLSAAQLNVLYYLETDDRTRVPAQVTRASYRVLEREGMIEGFEAGNGITVTEKGRNLLFEFKLLPVPDEVCGPGRMRHPA